uniref:DUF834 domain-containing protein n=1 Tax=Oryza nivara TaxID=4536 RepID=A0A0E0HYA2_ORYNI
MAMAAERWSATFLADLGVGREYWSPSPLMEKSMVTFLMLDIGADAGDRVAGEVGLVAAMAEDAEEGDDDSVVEAGVANLSERALVLVPRTICSRG